MSSVFVLDAWRKTLIFSICKALWADQRCKVAIENAQEHGQAAPGQEIHVTLKLMKICLVFFKIEMQMETSVQACFSPIGLAVSQNCHGAVWVGLRASPTYAIGPAATIRNVQVPAPKRSTHLITGHIGKQSRDIGTQSSCLYLLKIKIMKSKEMLRNYSRGTVHEPGWMGGMCVGQV